MKALYTNNHGKAFQFEYCCHIIIILFVDVEALYIIYFHLFMRYRDHTKMKILFLILKLMVTDMAGKSK